MVVADLSWCARRDLNLRPPASETVTLSTELRALIEDTSIVYPIICILSSFNIINRIVCTEYYNLRTLVLDINRLD